MNPKYMLPHAALQISNKYCPCLFCSVSYEIKVPLISHEICELKVLTKMVVVSQTCIPVAPDCSHCHVFSVLVYSISHSIIGIVLENFIQSI